MYELVPLLHMSGFRKRWNYTYCLRTRHFSERLKSIELKGSEPPVPRACGMGEAGSRKGVQLVSHTSASPMLSVTLKLVLQNSGMKGRYNSVHTLH